MDITRVSKIYDEIEGFSIELESDPTVLGPQYLGKVIAQCRNFLNRTTSILLEIRRERHMASNRLSAEKAAFKIESDGLLATDERVRSRPNIRDREAMINVILGERVNRIAELENDLRNLEAIEGAVKVRHTELVRTDGQIKTQRSLIRDEIDTKSFFGDESNTSSSRSSEVDEAELTRIMTGSTTELTSAEPSANLFALPLSESIEVKPESPETQLVDCRSKTSSVEAPSSEIQFDSGFDIETMDQEAVAETSQEIEPAQAVSVVDDEAEAIARFLASASDRPSEPRPMAKGRKPSKKKEDEPLLPSATSSGDPDFDDILANL